MCRNIRPLNNFEPPATSDEVRAAALQYVRKVSGATKPSKANEEVFNRAVEEIAHYGTESVQIPARLRRTARPSPRRRRPARRSASPTPPDPAPVRSA